jgi:CrcB protein
MNFLYIALGGSLGAISRYLVAVRLNELVRQTIPLATLFVNATGSFLIGFLFVMSENLNVPEEIRLLTITGFLGAYTTFSTYSLDTMRLVLEGKSGLAVVNFLLNNGLCLLLVIVGITVSKWLFPQGR